MREKRTRSGAQSRRNSVLPDRRDSCSFRETAVVSPARTELVGELERYKDSYRLCYVRGPEGIIIELAEQIG